MGHRRNIAVVLALLGTCTSTTNALDNGANKDAGNVPEQRRRLRAGDGHRRTWTEARDEFYGYGDTPTTLQAQAQQAERVEETKEREKAAKDFYDLSVLTKEEKLGVIKMAHTLHYGGSVDWDRQRDNFVRTVLEDKQRTRGSRKSDGSADGDDVKLYDLVDGGARADVATSKSHTQDWRHYAFYTKSTGDGNDDAYDGALDDTLEGEVDEATMYIDGNDDAYDGKLDDTLSGDIPTDPRTAKDTQQTVATSRHRQRHLQNVINNIDGAVFDAYEYSKGACPNAGSLGVPCAPDNVAQLCNKYERDAGSFRSCLDACSPAFCCIHDAPRDENFLAPNCNSDENCPQYNYCYIAWWKLHDTVGPALFLRVAQDDDFYDVEANEIEEDSTGDQLFTQVLLHHFDDINQVIVDGTVTNPDGSSEFNADRIFLDEEYWSYPVAGKVEIGDPRADHGG